MADFDDFFDEERKEFEDDLDEFKVDDPGFRDEALAYERAGGPGILHELVDESKNLRSSDPKDRFLKLVRNMSLNMRDIINISDADINLMLTRGYEAQNIQYKNPLAFILGYLATNAGREFSKDRIDYVINNILSRLEDNVGITPPDIVRYSRYWVLHLNS